MFSSMPKGECGLRVQFVDQVDTCHIALYSCIWKTQLSKINYYLKNEFHSTSNPNSNLKEGVPEMSRNG